VILVAFMAGVVECHFIGGVMCFRRPAARGCPRFVPCVSDCVCIVLWPVSRQGDERRVSSGSRVSKNHDSACVFDSCILVEETVT
jgi:hypothetical protein